MARVFISFKRNDEAAANGISEQLTARGHEVFRYDQELSAGPVWAGQLGREQREAGRGAAQAMDAARSWSPGVRRSPDGRR